MTIRSVSGAQYRKLRFSTLEEALADARICAQAARENRLSTCGSWSPGTLFGHLAFWINAGFDGYPLKVGLLMKVAGRLMKRAVLTKPPRRGVKIPGVPGGTFGTEELSLDEGMDALERAVARLVAKAPDKPNPLFGPMSHTEWLQLHTRHAEGHLGNLVY